ncbi:MAG: hypothetical protein D6761_11710 [Candidatus Dadabacteria bacterium]|nr:MAG: hypothetical protein D6761_11710 [Candidatus Dadabacteria bacterium]
MRMIQSTLSAALVVAMAASAIAGALPEQAMVQHVVKPDEFELSGGESVRLIGVDAPIADPAQRKGEYYGKAGFDWVRELVEGKQIRLHYDAEPRDVFDRLLAYVETADGVDLNLELLRRGYAVAACFPPNVSRCAEFSRAQQQAMQARKGIWDVPSVKPGASSANMMLRKVKVARVIDGDTIQLEDGTIVRYLGIDAPESEVAWRKGAFGYEAYASNKALVEGQEVLLEQDREVSDSRGRTLAWVWIDGEQGRELVNARLIEDGVAWVALFPPNTRHADKLFAAQQRAQQAKRGIWAAR